MPISIADLVVGKRKLSVTFPEGTLNITYDPNKINVKSESEMIELRAEGRTLGSLAAQLANVIVEWDVVDDKGKPIAPTAEAIQSLGYSVMVFLNRKIAEDFYPDPLAGLSSPSS